MTMPEPHWGHGPAVPLPFPALAAGGVLISGRGVMLVGWSVIETTGAAAAEVDLFDGHDASGTPVAYVSLSASQSSREALPRPGLALERGLWVQWITGSTKGVLWVVER